MKRWAIRIVALSTVVGLGWFTVTWAQQHFGAQATPGPDPFQTPVNAEAVAGFKSKALAGGATVRTEVVGTDDLAARRTGSADVQAGGWGTESRAVVNPFQGVAQTGGNYPAATVGGRYSAAEPGKLEADPNAIPIAPDPASSNRTAMRDDIPSAGEVGLADARGSAPRGDESAPNTAAANEFRYSDDGARQTSGIAATNGATEPASGESPRNAAAQLAIPAVPPRAWDDRYPNAATNVNDDRRAATTNDTISSPAADPFPRSNAVAADSNLLQQVPSRTTANPADLSRLSGSGLPANGLNGSRDDGLSGAAAPIGNSLAPVINTEGFGKPGDKKLEGAQSPSVTIEKIAPPEIQVGKVAKFEVVVRNTGPVLAENVEVTEVVPQGTQLVNTVPRTAFGQRGEILWKVGDLKPGQDAKLEVELMPLAEGEIGSMAVVQFRSTASMRTIATKPDLLLELTAPKQVMIGQDALVKIKLNNRGTGAAGKVVMQAKIPPGFQHPAGSELEFDVGQFKPGDSRELDLTLRAVAAGRFAPTLSAQGDANLRVEQIANIEVIAPALEVKLNGPKVRYLERQAKYTVSVANPGTAAARELKLVARLPKGLQFVEASDAGQFDAATNSVQWGLDELPAGESGSVTLTALAKEPGDQKLRGEVKAAGGLSEAAEQMTVVEGVAAVLFTVVDVDDPVEIGGKATYEIHIVNQGSKAANRLQIAALFPPEIKPLSAEGPSKQAIEGQRIVFEPLARLAPKADITYRVVGQCLAAGDMRVTVQLLTDEMNKPVTKEESTRVYKD